MKNKYIHLEVSIEPELRIICNPVQLSQVLLNLLNNAIDAVQGCSIKKIELKALSNSEQIRISVTDSGCGIADNNKDKILDPFFSTKPVGTGTGLGLSISQKIIADHQGHIEFTSREGRTEFVLFLPNIPAQTSGHSDLHSHVAWFYSLKLESVHEPPL